MDGFFFFFDNDFMRYIVVRFDLTHSRRGDYYFAYCFVPYE